MRKWIIIGSALLGLASCGRKVTSSNVSEPVQTSFNTQFPNAKNAEWRNVKENYSVKFYDSNTYIYAKFNKDGTLNKALPQCTVACLD